jgi:4-hydroxybenzoate polyprenyltransferase
MLPQVLAGLGLFSLLSTGCLIWLQRLQPVFFALALASLGYQIWLVWKRPPDSRTRGVKLTLAASLVVNLSLIAGWIVISIRYA